MTIGQDSLVNNLTKIEADALVITPTDDNTRTLVRILDAVVAPNYNNYYGKLPDGTYERIGGGDAKITPIP